MIAATRPFLLACVLALALAAPGRAATPYVIGVVYWSMAIPGQVAMRRGLEAAAAEINRSRPPRPIRLIAFVGGDGEEGIRRQRAAMAHLVRRRPDAIILQPIDSAALSGPVQDANRANIPVVAYDQYVLNGRLACYLTSNNTLAGTLDGEYLAYRFRSRTRAHPLRLVIVEYPYVTSTVERVEGLLDALVKSGTPYRIVARYQAIEPKAGRAVGRAIARNHPRGTVDAVFCVNDGGGLDIKRQLEAAKRTDIVMATIDGDPASVRSIVEGGAIGIDTAQFCGALGAESLKVTHRLLRGERIPRQVLVTVFPVTKASVAAFPGWDGAVPRVIRRPWPPYEQVPGNRLTW
ncbi:MAG TPA: sugar ABC transporter substrate-binding protein [Pantanalinema sp.]